MKKCKIVVSILLSMMLTIGLIGCSRGGGTSGGGSTEDEIDPNQNITLTVQSATPLRYNYNALLASEKPGSSLYKQGQFTKFVVEGFKKLYPNIKLKFVENGWGDALYQANVLKVRDWQSGGKMDVDIMIGETFMGYFAKNGVFAPLNNENFTDVLEGSVSDMMVDGKLYGVPMCTGIVGLQYNTTVLKEAGISEDKYEPKTWDELLENCKKVSDYAAANSKDYSGIIMNCVSGLSSIFRALPVMRQAGGDVVDANGNVVVNSAENNEAYEYLRKLATYSYGNSLSESNEDSLQALFVEGGKSAYMMEGQWSMASAAENIKSAQLPKKDATDTKNGNAFIGNVMFSVTEGSSNKAAAAAFLKYFTSKEVQLELYKLDGRLPISKSALNSEEIRATHPQINSYIDSLNAGGFNGSVPHFVKNANEIWGKWGEFYKQVLTGTGDIAALSDGLKANIDELKK